jgi:hypothetical protein
MQLNNTPRPINSWDDVDKWEYDEGRIVLRDESV